MKYKELVDDARREIEDEKKQYAIGVIKERLLEIEEAEQVLAELKDKFEGMLDECIE